ncbi:hypothetical protein FPRO05_00228 [Fusarium proliferatum]|uniref:2EXR domain-containing protein n=1 Tax=Gibberella intermedia TaxID=948311 RepID=A0A365NM22_GIBIN|nr:hypothetical protein FPRO05_00228 [Fusarium proliferatum]
MGERTFPLFSQLPLELREQIYKMAMRPDKPGVQIFRVYDPEPDNPVHARDIMGFSVTGASQRRWSLPPCLSCPPRLALPLWNKYPDSTNGLSDHDISTYLIDSSLWTVCHESRSMMRRVFGVNDASSQRCLGSATAHYLSGSAPSWITIFPKNDLIVLQFDDMFKFNWIHLLDLFHTKAWSFGGVLNLGIEYDVEWGIFHSERELFHLASCSLYVNIWLIDHNLKRREGTPPQKDSVELEYENPVLHASFYANDRKFLRVNLEQEDDCMGHWRYLKVLSEDYEDSSIHFANQLREEVWLLNRDNFLAPPCSVGLLGWDDI